MPFEMIDFHCGTGTLYELRGPSASGKTSFLEQKFPDAIKINTLRDLKDDRLYQIILDDRRRRNTIIIDSNVGMNNVALAKIKALLHSKHLLIPTDGGKYVQDEFLNPIKYVYYTINTDFQNSMFPNRKGTTVNFNHNKSVKNESLPDPMKLKSEPDEREPVQVGEIVKFINFCEKNSDDHLVLIGQLKELFFDYVKSHLNQ